jgi:hypothetical protein
MLGMTKLMGSVSNGTTTANSHRRENTIKECHNTEIANLHKSSTTPIT